MAENRDSSQVTSGRKERISQALEILTPVFEDDPVYNWFLHTTSNEVKHKSHYKLLIQAIVKACGLAGAHIIQAGNWGACAVLVPPGAKADGPWNVIQAGLVPVGMTVGLSTCKRVLVEYATAADKTKSKGMTKEEKTGYWYVAIMGTLSDRRRQGLAGELLHKMQDRARGDGRPLWLEATTPHSRDLYTQHGFVLVEEIVIGQGSVGPDGKAKKGAAGFPIWGMVWRPEKRS